MIPLVSVEGHPHLARNPKSGAVVNINSSSIEQARLAKARRIDETTRRVTNEARLDTLESKMDQMLEILQSVAKNV
jgi:hypothetical protein